ncbi:DUF418 domain-containing protein [Aquincola sp. S2]|uniref:DUF418 domain-containing protein n=1 Tax=Pseudaquabacterium terrae TaxID=2732868 RepID=A0ABX2EHN3_9BURK|nr:DUF418 domain-containing protein [Aquabacterium terrae]NRF68134.1 DUF418 domain-containing protein [Aquabacterium terrae]
MPNDPPEPDRLRHVDALRGFALLGILAVNIGAFADSWFGTFAPNPAFGAPLDQAVRFSVTLLFETKFYLLFAFLFGVSFTLQMSAAARAGAAFEPRLLRRQGGLLLLGLLHGLLLFDGDILLLYGLLGLVLLAWRDWPPRRALRIAVTLVVASAMLWLLAGAAIVAIGVALPADDSIVRTRLAGLGGDAAATLRYYLTQWRQSALTLLLLQAPGALAAFLVGFAAGRSGVLSQPALAWPAVRRIVIFGWPLGLSGALVYAWARTTAPGLGADFVALGLSLLTGPLLTAAYVAGALALFQTPRGQRIEQWLAPLGRMALSNYLGQSVVLGLIFTGYGLRLIDRLPPPAVLALVPAIIAVQAVFSRWWLQRHAYGPAEWVLRAITTARLPRWRLAAAS